MTPSLETYEAMRQFADSWSLLFMVIAFSIACLLALTASRAAHRDQASIPFRHEDAPAPEPRGSGAEQ